MHCLAKLIRVLRSVSPGHAAVGIVFAFLAVKILRIALKRGWFTDIWAQIPVVGDAALPGESTIQSVVVCTITLCIVAHGVTANAWANRMAKSHSDTSS